MSPSSPSRFEFGKVASIGLSFLKRTDPRPQKGVGHIVVVPLQRVKNGTAMGEVESD